MSVYVAAFTPNPLDLIDPDELALWPEDDLAELMDLVDRLAELDGIRPDPLPWPTSDPDHLLRQIAPNYATARLVAHHLDWWRWVYAVQPGVAPRPFAGIWARGLAKTSSVELGVSMLGALLRRRYCLFVTRTQDGGNGKITDFQEVLTAPHFAARYPDMARVKEIPMYSTAGRTRRRAAEWSRTRLRTACGFNVEAVGLDVAVRGIKIGDQRPDLIVFDDLDDPSDKPGYVTKMLDTIRTSIIPAGSPDVAFVFINNLVHENSIASHITYPERFDPKERLLLKRILSGPIPAVYGLEVAYNDNDAGDGEPGYVITAGSPAWPDHLGIVECQNALNNTNLAQFLREYQHETESDGGVFSHIDFVYVDLEEVPWGRMLTVHVWVDPATSDTDRSDSMGIACAGVDVDGVIWALYSWEKITTPTDALKKAIKVAYQYGASVLGVETDNGGDAWKPVFREALREMKEDAAVGVSFEGVSIPPDWEIFYDAAKAGQTNKSKEERHKQLITPFERKRVRIVRGTGEPLVKCLRRFPRKPLDGLDAFWWAWSKLVAAAAKSKTTTKTKAKARRPTAKPRMRR